VTLALAAEMLLAAGIATSQADGVRLAREALDGGAAAERFARMVHALGGPSDFVEKHASHLPHSLIGRIVAAPHAGFVTRIATRDVGLAVVALGGGRTNPGDSIDLAVGVTRLLPLGAEVLRGDPLAMIHARTESDADVAAAALLAAYELGEAKPAARDSVVRRIPPTGGDGY
jgi:thymidine phosphorylase